MSDDAGHSERPADRSTATPIPWAARGDWTPSPDLRFVTAAAYRPSGRRGCRAGDPVRRAEIPALDGNRFGSGNIWPVVRRGNQFHRLRTFYEQRCCLSSEHEAAGLRNVRLFDDDVRLLLQAARRLPGSLYILFADPWPKRRHAVAAWLAPKTWGHSRASARGGSVVRHRP